MVEKEIDYYEMFGMEAPKEGEGEKEEQPAEAPDENDVENGEKEDETAERPVDDAGDEEETEQTDEENARYASIRRKAEADAAAKAAKELDQRIAELGSKDEYGNPIETYEAFTAYNRRKAEKERKQDEEDDVERLLDMGHSEEEAKEIVEARRAKARLDELEHRLKDMEAQARQAQFEADVKEELPMIRALDPTIKTVDDLRRATENNDVFMRHIRNGKDFLSAYMRSHQNAFYAALDKTPATGKQHLRRTETRGGGGGYIAESTLNAYKWLNPNATRAEIIEFEQKLKE